MKHYRILENKENYNILENKVIQKQFTIQYLKPIFFGLHTWKKLNNIIYNKYDEALTEIKKVIKQEDYETDNIGYHYIDAYKIFKTKIKEVPSNIPTKRTNTSVFVPKNK